LGLSYAVTLGAEEGTGNKFVGVGRERCNDQPRFRASVAKVVEKKHAAVWLLIAVDESAYVAVLADEDAALLRGFSQQRAVARICGPFRPVGDIVAGVA
jgi:hypothetical protein